MTPITPARRTPLEWDVITTASVPNEVLAWKSVEGSEIENAGIVRFRANPEGTTQVDIKISYNPPAGALGHAVASLRAARPRHSLRRLGWTGAGAGPRWASVLRPQEVIR